MRARVVLCRHGSGYRKRWDVFVPLEAVPPKERHRVLMDKDTTGHLLETFESAAEAGDAARDTLERWGQVRR